MTPTFFATPALWRRWLAGNHGSRKELWVGFYKVGTGRPSITWPESVDEALCYGWIDGVRRSIDADSYAIRFTPRRPSSTWSRVNIARVAELKRRRKMRAPGLRAFENRRSEEPPDRAMSLSPDYLRRFRANAAAWRFFDAQRPSYRKTAAGWVMSAKREETRERRLATLIGDSARGRTIAPLTRPKGPGQR